MTRNEYFDLVIKTEHNDWYFNNEDTATYKYNSSIRLVMYSDLNDICDEPWAIRHPNKRNWKRFVTFYFNESQIFELVLIGVDSGRAYLPYPNLQTNKIPFFTYRLAMICEPSGLDEYIRRCGFTVDDSLDTEEKYEQSIIQS